MSATSDDGIRGLDMELTERPTRESLANTLALIMTAPDDERSLAAFDIAWRIARRLDERDELLPGDWQDVKASAIELADEWRRESA